MAYNADVHSVIAGERIHSSELEKHGYPSHSLYTGRTGFFGTHGTRRFYMQTGKRAAISIRSETHHNPSDTEKVRILKVAEKLEKCKFVVSSIATEIPPRVQNIGIARALAKELNRIAKQIGADAILAYSGNPKAIRILTSTGWEQVTKMHETNLYVKFLKEK